MLSNFLFCCLLFFALTCNICNCEVNEEEQIREAYVCGRNGYVLIATIDGNISSIDFETGEKCWTTMLDKEGIFSSSLYKLEVWENGTEVKLIPSLDGSLFRYDKVKLEPLPFNAELFLTQSASLDESTFVTGGKFKIIYGINEHSGEIFYTCSVNGCKTFSEVSTQDALVIELLVQSVNAVDSITAEQKWHFKVAEIQIKVLNSELPNKESFYRPHSENSSAVVLMNDGLSIESSIKISLLKGYAARRSLSQNYVWFFKPSTPIIDAWYVKDRVILLDPFADETEFFRIDSLDGEHAALLFLGSYMNEFFVKQSRKLKSKTMFNSALAKPVVYKAFCLPLQLNANMSGNSSNDSDSSNGVVLANPNFHDIGFYFYIDFSVLDNDTHCVVDFKYPKVFETLVDYLWMKFFTISFAVLACCVALLQHMMLKQKKFTSEGTSTSENLTEEKPQEYISRFHKDFKLISILGRGGFGVVMEAKNVIDDCKYAVKRIKVFSEGRSHSKEEFVLREVKALAKLDHLGIVRYFNSWVEYPPIGWQENLDKSSNIGFKESLSYSDDYEATRSSSSSSKSIPQAKLGGIMRKNPLNPFYNIRDSSRDLKKNFNVQFSQGQLSSASSSNMSDSTLSSSSDSNSSANVHAHSSLDDNSDSIVFRHQNDNSDSIVFRHQNDNSDSIVFRHQDDNSDSVVFRHQNDNSDSIVFRHQDDYSDSIVFSHQDDNSDSIVFSHQLHSQENIEFIQEKPFSNCIDSSAPLFYCRNESVRNCERTFSDLEDYDREEIDYYSESSILSLNEVFNHLLLVNKDLAYPMHTAHLQHLKTYLFCDGYGVDVEDEQWTYWITIVKEIPQSEIFKHLKMLQTWFISVLVFMQQTKSSMHKTLCYNICNILWDIEFGFGKSYAFQKDTIGIVRRFNNKLSFPMKLPYLEKLELYLFHKYDNEKPNQILATDWKEAFYCNDERIFSTNLYFFRIWLISMLCHFYYENDILDFVVCNFSSILCEVNNWLEHSQKSYESTSPSLFFEYYKNCFEELDDVQFFLLDKMNFSMFKNVSLFKNSETNEYEGFTKNELMEIEDTFLTEKNIKRFEKSVKRSEIACQFNTETNDSFLYIQMQLCRRDNLKKWLDSNYKERDYGEVMSIFTQIVDAIEYVHAQGLMHRDLKPSNIYFSLEGTIKIGDFGLATHFEVTNEKESSTSKLKSHTSECGTELYMSPEQRSKKVYDFKTDIFPLGIILYELLVPFFTHFERQKAIVSARNQEFIPKFTETYPNEAMLARRLLEKNPKNRPSASEIKGHPVCQEFIRRKK